MLPMRIWFHQLHESQRSFTDLPGEEITIGRDRSNALVLSSPLIARQQAVLRQSGNTAWIQNLGMNSCLVGDTEVLGGSEYTFSASETIRIWPYTLTLESTEKTPISRQDLESHLRGLLADLELKVHRRLLERFDLHELEANRIGDPQSLVRLERQIEDVCRELQLFTEANEPLLEELVGLNLRDYIVQQLILETDSEAPTSLKFLQNEFDVPATLIPEREGELVNLLKFARGKLGLDSLSDLSSRITRVEKQFADVFGTLRPHLHKELRKYLVLRTLKKDLKDTILGFGPLQDLLRAPTISEIMVVRSDQIYVERDGVIELSGRRFLSDKVTESIIERIVAQVGRRIDRSQPLVDARLPDGSRVNAIIPPLAVRGPCLTIRKFPSERFSIDELIEGGTLTRPAAMFLRACVIGRKNLLVSGGTGSGKTTMLNVLSSFIPSRDRIVTVEDVQELQLRQDHVVSLETRPANVEGAGEYTIRDLVKNALRMRPDRILVGECRGIEALDMLQAMNTGHDGSMTTLHSNSSEETIKRLEVLVLSAVELPVVAIHRQIASALDIVVQIARLPGGKRVITQISEIDRYDDRQSKIVIHDIFRRHADGELLATGYLPTFVEPLLEQGILSLDFLSNHATKTTTV
jgi:pilus assembly protein CpaF